MENEKQSMVFPACEKFDEPPYIGTLQQLLSMNKGKTVRIDSMIGSNTAVTYTGTIHEVGRQYIALDQPNACCVVIDVFSIKFVTFLSGE